MGDVTSYTTEKELEIHFLSTGITEPGFSRNVFWSLLVDCEPCKCLYTVTNIYVCYIYIYVHTLLKKHI